MFFVCAYVGSQASDQTVIEVMPSPVSGRTKSRWSSCLAGWSADSMERCAVFMAHLSF